MRNDNRESYNNPMMSREELCEMMDVREAYEELTDREKYVIKQALLIYFK